MLHSTVLLPKSITANTHKTCYTALSYSPKASPQTHIKHATQHCLTLQKASPQTHTKHATQHCLTPPKHHHKHTQNMLHSAVFFCLISF